MATLIRPYARLVTAVVAAVWGGVVACLILMLVGCDGFMDHKKDPRLAYLPHPASAAAAQFRTVTPRGRVVCYDALGSEAAGYVTLDEILLAIDTECDAFEAAHPDAAGTTFRCPILLHDDYVYWVIVANGYPHGSWAAGDTDGSSYVRTALWSRIETTYDPRPEWIVRDPGNSFGTVYTVWRHTGRPLVPALQHEFGHVAYGPGYGH